MPRHTVLYLDHTAKWSGGEIALLRTLEALDREKVDPVVLLAAEGPFADRLRALNIETHIRPLGEDVREVRKDSLGARGIVQKLGIVGALWNYARDIARFARQRGVTLIHCNSLKSDFYGALAGRIARLPVVWHVRDHIEPAYLPRPAVTAIRSAAKWLPTRVITNSESTAEALFPGGVDRRRCSVVHDGLSDSELTTPAPPIRDSWKHQPPRIGMVGRLVEWKGQHIFLDAAHQLTEQGIAARYVLIGAPLFGEQGYEAQLHRQAEGLEESVEFLGFRSDVSALVQDLDLLVHASISPEPFGQVVIEGMAEGIPVVASDGGGVREIITPGQDGLRTPMGDAAALTSALRELLRSPERATRMGRSGWETVREKFTAASTARKIEALYDDMMPRKQAAVPTSNVLPRPGTKSDSSAADAKGDGSEIRASANTERTS